MKNLIQNSNWCCEGKSMPKCFSGSGMTYDNFCICSCRTCSVTIPEDSLMVATCLYDPAIQVCGQRRLVWGCQIRAIEPGCVKLVVEFYDHCDQLLSACECDIGQRVTCDFSHQCAHFAIPCGAEKAHLSIQFSGKVTACTIFSPTAYFC